MNDKNENLKDLVSSFYPADQIDDILEDIRVGDEIIASGKELAVDANVISDIKLNISKQIKATRRKRMSSVSMRTAIAAMLAIAAFHGVRGIFQDNASSMSSAYAKSSFWVEDATAGMMADELDDIENTMVSISLDEYQVESDLIVESLELEIDEAATSFWRS